LEGIEGRTETERKKGKGGRVVEGVKWWYKRRVLHIHNFLKQEYNFACT
jgi:hypothetical protein